MKKLFSAILCICMISTYTSIPAMAMTTDITVEKGLMQAVETNESNGEEVTPFNVDYVQFSPSKGYYGRFRVNKGDNVKIHMYIDSYTKGWPIRVNLQKGNGSMEVVAVWTDTGHKYADLCLNCPATMDFVVWLEGTGFSGTGAVYREP